MNEIFKIIFNKSQSKVDKRRGGGKQSKFAFVFPRYILSICIITITA